MQTAEAAVFIRMPSGRDSPKTRRWPLSPLRPRRAAYGVAGLRSGSGQGDARHALMAKSLANKPRQNYST